MTPPIFFNFTFLDTCFRIYLHLTLLKQQKCILEKWDILFAFLHMEAHSNVFMWWRFDCILHSRVHTQLYSATEKEAAVVTDILLVETLLLNIVCKEEEQWQSHVSQKLDAMPYECQHANKTGPIQRMSYFVFTVLCYSQWLHVWNIRAATSIACKRMLYMYVHVHKKYVVTCERLLVSLNALSCSYTAIPLYP